MFPDTLMAGAAHPDRNNWREGKMNKAICLAPLLSLLLVPSYSLSASIYKCKAETGEINYSEYPCNKGKEIGNLKNNETGRVEPKPESKTTDKKTNDRSDWVISETELQGTWSSHKEGGPLNSTWTFNKPNLTFRKPNGLMVNATYSLENNIITVHHDTWMSQRKRWNETYQLISFDGNKLSWRSLGVLMSVYK